MGVRASHIVVSVGLRCGDGRVRQVDLQVKRRRAFGCGGLRGGVSVLGWVLWITLLSR